MRLYWLTAASDEYYISFCTKRLKIDWKSWKIFFNCKCHMYSGRAKGSLWKSPDQSEVSNPVGREEDKSSRIGRCLFLGAGLWSWFYCSSVWMSLSLSQIHQEEFYLWLILNKYESRICLWNRSSPRSFPLNVILRGWGVCSPALWSKTELGYPFASCECQGSDLQFRAASRPV